MAKHMTQRSGRCGSGASFATTVPQRMRGCAGFGCDAQTTLARTCSHHVAARIRQRAHALCAVRAHSHCRCASARRAASPTGTGIVLTAIVPSARRPLWWVAVRRPSLPIALGLECSAADERQLAFRI